jgi:predicted ribosome quality control (RQC) complex YloA/Tae2 family protein
MAHVAGAGQDTFAEILCRAGVAVKATIAPDDAATWSAVAIATQDVASRAAHQAWEPTAILDDEGHIVDGTLFHPCVAAAQPQKRLPSVNELLAAYFATREWQDALGGARASLRRTLKTTQDRLQKKLTALRGELAELQQADRLRAEGELLLAFASDIPDGAITYIPPDLGDGATPQPIILEARLSAIENANARFARYHKMRRAAAQIPEQIDRAEVDLARADQLATDLDLADSLAEIAQVREEVTAARIGNTGAAERKPRLQKGKAKGKGKDKSGKQARPGSNPLTLKSADGFPLYVGKNSVQNEYVTFVVASGSDLWFHARGVPGAHVVIKNGGRPVAAETVQEAARLAAWYSQSRGSGSVPVDYTDQRYVRHMKNGGPGMVIYTHERTIQAVPRDAPAEAR